MSELDDLDVVRSIYDAMAARDFDRLVALVDPEVVITQDARLPWGGRHVGHDGVANFALALTGAITSAVMHHELFAADGDVVQVGHTKGTVNASGVEFDIPEVHCWTIRDGRAVAAHFSIDTPGMLKALGATSHSC
jgi:uncharacterized protein